MTAGDRDATIRELRIGDIVYPGNSGCAGARAGTGAPGPCQAEVVAAAMKHYQGPERPHYARVYLCQLHARLEAAEPLTDEDRSELERRRAERAHWEKVRLRQYATRARDWPM